MVNGELVIDAVAHAYDRSRENRSSECEPEEYERLQRNSHQQASALEPKADDFALSLEDWSARWSGKALAETYFLESDVDIAIHHHVQIPYFFQLRPEGGASRWDASVDMRKCAPGRVFLYAGIDTFDPDRSRTFEAMERYAADGAIGFKFYPNRGFFDKSTNEFLAARYDDPEGAYPYFEKARSLGIRRLAFHKAQPIGPGPIEALRPTDVSRAAQTFPEMTFEIVHDGWAFLEESALQLRLFSNIYANLEIVANLVNRQPRRFAEIIGTLLRDGCGDRILFATGCGYNHPDPIVRGISDFQMPVDLRDGMGYPELTPDIKKKILGGNACTLLGLDQAAKKAELAGDDWSLRRRAMGDRPVPWGAHKRDLAARLN